MNNTTRIVIADDYDAIRAALRAALTTHEDIEIVCEAGDGDEALRCCRDHNANILLLDLGMSGPAPRDIVQSLKETMPDLRVLVLTINESLPMVKGLLDAGIAGYILKDDVPDELVPMIRRALDGGIWYSRSIIEKYGSLLDHPDVP